MEIQHNEGPDRGKFFIEQEGERLAALVYYKDGEALTIEHTEVDKALRGKNIGYQLVHRTVELAREQGRKVAPVCPFAKALFEKNPEWRELLADSF